LFNIGITISADPPAIFGIPNLMPTAILLIFNESASSRFCFSELD